MVPGELVSLHYYLFAHTQTSDSSEYTILCITHRYYRANLHGKKRFPNRFSVPIHYIANHCLTVDFRKLSKYF